MAKWVTTIWYHLHYGYQLDTEKGGWFSNGTTLSFTTPRDTLYDVLEKFTEYMDQQQASIKAVLPLNNSVAHYDYKTSTLNNASYGYGYGYGVTPTVGAVVIAQYEQEVPQEEYERLIQARDVKNELDGLQSECEQLQEVVNADSKRDTSIVEKKKLLGGLRYFVDGEEFSTEAEAKLRQADLIAQIEANRQNLEETQARHTAALEELEKLES